MHRRPASPLVLAFAVLGTLHQSARAAAPWQYEIALSADAEELAVQAELTAPRRARLSVDDGAEPFVRDVQVEQQGRWRRIDERGGYWHLPDCSKRPCRVRYRFLLGRAADALDSENAERFGRAIQAPPSTWLLRPFDGAPSSSYELRIHTPPELAFASGMPRRGGSDDAGDRYRTATADLDLAPYTVFGPLRTFTIERPGGRIEVALVPSQRRLAERDILAWINRAADALVRYYGRLPVDHVLLAILPIAGNRVHGTTLGSTHPSIRLLLGRDADADDLADDWVLTHELVHLAFPSVPRRSLWLEEGLATYVEPLARFRAGQHSAAQVWTDLIRGLPNGLPEPGDRGLDRTHTWGRTYWGGALFCLLADLRIRERTQNRRSLDDALRAIVHAGGNISVRWSVERALSTGDRATGVPVLRELYDEMARRPITVTLDELWQRLGVTLERRRVRYNDDAPLAAVRRAIASPK